MSLSRRGTLLAGLLGIVAQPSLASPPPLRGLAVEESLAGEALLAESLNAALLRARGLPIFARIGLLPSELTESVGGSGFERLDERVDRYKTKGVPVLLAIGGPLPGTASADSWRRFLRSLVERYRGVVAGYEFGDGKGDAAAPDFAFAFKLAAVEVRAVDPEAFLLLGLPRAESPVFLERLYAEDIAAYVDAVVVPDAVNLAACQALMEGQDANSVLVLGPLDLEDGPALVASQVLEGQLGRLGGRVPLTVYRGPVPAMAAALQAVNQVKDLLTGEVVRLDDEPGRLQLFVDDRDVTTLSFHLLLYNLDNLSTYLFSRRPPGEPGVLTISLGDRGRRQPVLRDLLAGTAKPMTGHVWDPTALTTRVKLPPSDGPLLVEFRYAESAAAARTEVSERGLPEVGEIVFKHQQAQAAQDARLETTIANAQIETHFRPNSTDSGFDVVTVNRFFSDGSGSEWEEQSFTLNGSKWGSDRPPFPLLQPEKVLSLPLDLRLTRDYLYRLEGVEKVDTRECYVVRFEPAGESRSLYRGTVWIDTKSFVKLKVQAVQTRLSPPVISNEEVQYFAAEATVDGMPLYLMSRFTSRQVMLVAGRNLLVEKLVRFSDFVVNPGDFSAQRAAARKGDNVMYRDTDEGLRHLVKRGEERVVQDRPVTSAKALAVGVTVDPSFDYPLPIVGINYLDFEFLGKDTQLALLFGGVLALANVQKPKALGDRVDVSVDLFAIAVAVNDQVFDEEGEVREQRLRNRPFSTGVNLGYQLTSFQKLLSSYQFRFDAYSSDEQTDPAFIPPVDTVTNVFGLGYEYRRGGYSLVLGGTYNRRAQWEPWGSGDEYSADQVSYWKYSGSLSKDFFFRALHKVHLNLAYYGGVRLDRFSQYQFGMFDDNKVRGVPSAGVRFQELAMLRASYSLNLFEQYRLDLFFDQALGRAGDGSPRESITGLGLGLNFRAPWGTMVRAEVGKSFLPERYRGSGSVVGQVMVLKPF